MIFAWICLGAYFLYLKDNQCTIVDYKILLIEDFLTNTNYLIPLNVFMYSWRYLTSLENEGKGSWRQLIRLFKKVSLWAVPVTYYALYVALSISNAHSNFCQLNDPTEECKKWTKFLSAFNKAQGYLSTLTNLIACGIMALVVTSVWKLTHSGYVFAGHES